MKLSVVLFYGLPLLTLCKCYEITFLPLTAVKPETIANAVSLFGIGGLQTALAIGFYNYVFNYDSSDKTSKIGRLGRSSGKKQLLSEELRHVVTFLDARKCVRKISCLLQKKNSDILTYRERAILQLFPERLQKLPETDGAASLEVGMQNGTSCDEQFQQCPFNDEFLEELLRFTWTKFITSSSSFEFRDSV